MAGIGSPSRSAGGTGLARGRGQHRPFYSGATGTGLRGPAPRRLAVFLFALAAAEVSRPLRRINEPGTVGSLRDEQAEAGKRLDPLSQPGLWAKSRVRAAALSTAITKHTRSGPRLGNGAFVYFREIGSM